eukprot:356735-Chlamydomonas_euryale.AAC.5
MELAMPAAAVLLSADATSGTSATLVGQQVNRHARQFVTAEAVQLILVNHHLGRRKDAAGADGHALAAAEGAQNLEGWRGGGVGGVDELMSGGVEGWRGGGPEGWRTGEVEGWRGGGKTWW